MADSVVVTSPDSAAAVLSPTLTDAIAAAQLYVSEVLAAQIIVLTAQASVNNSEAVALNAAISAQASATAAAISGGGGGISTTVALLPIGSEGLSGFATNGRKIGEGAGSGTGVRVYFSNSAWRVISTDSPVQA